VNTAENLFASGILKDAVFVTDPALDSKPGCDLLLLIDRQKVQLSLKERRSGQILAMEIITAEAKKFSGWRNLLENVSSSSRILRNYEFRQVSAGIISNQYTLVPEALFKAGDETIYFKKNFSDSLNYNIRFHQIPQNHLSIVFGVEPELEAELMHLFQDPQIWHHSQALVAGFPALAKSDSGKGLWINIHNELLDIVVSENKKLLLTNTFHWQTNEDILYYTLFVSEQLEINTGLCNVNVTGNIVEGSALFSLLYKYFNNVNLPGKPSTVSSAFQREDISFHEFALMYNLSLCE
jgi:hypothetical protein